ncbi:Titin [Sarcoptes scabiei]|nr:Titin [Sarcoptes scabiei]
MTINNFSIENVGIYTLNMINSAGEKNYDFELKMLKKPGPPEQPIRCIANPDDSIEISWNPPKDDGGSPVSHFKIDVYDTVNRPRWTEISRVDGNRLSYVVSNSNPGVRYKFRVISINDFGESDPAISDSIICRKRLKNQIRLKGQ